MSLLELRGVSKTYGRHASSATHALTDLTLDVEAGSIAGLVGESGSGKSTTIRCILGLEKPDQGSIAYSGVSLLGASRQQMRQFRRQIQVVFQDPTGSLNPRMTVGQLIGEGIAVHKLAASASDRRARVVELMRLVGLDERDVNRYSRSFSGGQRQRIAIARALAVEPELLICDEAVSALDVSVQAQILNLLMDMRKRFGLTVLFVAHDLGVIRQICTDVAILQGGQIVESGSCADIFESPQAEYTRQLLDAVPIPDPPVARQRARERLRLT